MYTLTKNRLCAKPQWLIISILSLLFSAACSQAAEHAPQQAHTPHSANNISDNTKQSKRKACPAARPEICTMIYNPVCAVKANGEKYTESSDCLACAQKDVVAYEEGECANADK
jgi:hypothetical protein